ncbi:MAG: hypothetical protein WCY37_04270 [Candidatus Dojkabacteria bacterium]
MPHTEECWANTDNTVFAGIETICIAPKAGDEVTINGQLIPHVYVQHSERRNNLDRITACVNACKGIPTANLEGIMLKIVEVIRRLKAIAATATIGQILADSDALEASGLNPYCVHEGLATGDMTLELWWAQDVLDTIQEEK